MKFNLILMFLKRHRKASCGKLFSLALKDFVTPQLTITMLISTVATANSFLFAAG